MSMTKYFVQNRVLFSGMLVTALHPVIMEAASESDRLEKLERAVEQLQKRNAELEAEVRSLKKETASVPDGKFKTKVTHDGKTYVEKAVPEEQKIATIRPAARTGIETGAGRIRTDQF